MRKLFLIVLLLFSPLNAYAGYSTIPTPEYSNYIIRAQLLVALFATAASIITYFYILKWFTKKRNLFVKNKTLALIALYLSLGSYLFYIYIYIFALPSINSLINIYEDSASLLLFGLFFIHPFFWISFFVSLIFSKYVEQFLEKNNVIRNMLFLSIIQLPILGIAFFYLFTRLFYFLYPFIGKAYISP